MADKRKKRPKHTSFVLPGESKSSAPKAPAKDRLGRTAGSDAPAQTPPRPDAPPQRTRQTGRVSAAESDTGRVGPASGNTGRTRTGQTARAKVPQTAAARQTTGQIPPDELPDNAILMPSVAPELQQLRRKRLFRRLRILLVVLMIPALFLFFLTGANRTLALYANTWMESAKIALTPGEGFPADFNVTGFIKAEAMGTGGFAALGERDLVLYSASGKELRRSQHSYVNAGLTTGNTRVCLYQRGGKEFVVEGRTSTVAERRTESDILFCELSPAGWLAVGTLSSHSATVEVYSPQSLVGTTPETPIPPQFRWSMSDDKPLMAAFDSDDKTFALGCVSVEGGALGSTVHIMRTDSTTPVCSIRAAGATVLKLEFLQAGRLLALFDTHAAIYSAGGEELARYSYGDRALHSSYYASNRLVLVYGASSSEMAEMEVLDSSLEPVFAARADSAAPLQPFADSEGVYLLCGGRLLVYDRAGTLLHTQSYDARTYALVRGGETLLLTAGKAWPVQELLSGDPSSQSAASAAPDSASEVGAGSEAGDTAGSSESLSHPDDLEQMPQVVDDLVPEEDVPAPAPAEGETGDA